MYKQAQIISFKGWELFKIFILPLMKSIILLFIVYVQV